MPSASVSRRPPIACLSTVEPAGASSAKALRPSAVGEAGVQVHARARQLGERLGHEAGELAVARGHAAHRALEQHRFVDGAQRIGAVFERDLELAGSVLRHQRAHRQAERLRGGIEIVEQRRHVVEASEAVGLDPVAAPARQQAARGP